MKRPTFFQGVGVALVISFLGALAYWVLAHICPPYEATRVLVAAVGLGYFAYLLAITPARVGRITMALVWLSAVAALTLFDPPLLVHIATHVAFIWLVRTVYVHRSLVGATADAALSVFSVAASLWALAHTSSIGLALWCFALPQALYVCIPTASVSSRPTPADDPFERAHRSAEVALRRAATG